MRAVPVVVIGMCIIVDEVIPIFEVGAGQIRCLHVLSVIFIGYAGIDDGNHDAGISPIIRSGDIRIPGSFEIDLVKMPLVGVKGVIRLP